MPYLAVNKPFTALLRVNTKRYRECLNQARNGLRFDCGYSVYD